MKLRIKVGHDCFEGTYYVIQKRTMLFFWLDISGWLFDLETAIRIKDSLQEKFDLGVIQ